MLRYDEYSQSVSVLITMADWCKQVLTICMQLNIRCVSVYGFSIENFKRSPQEVDDLLSLVEEKLLEICQYGQVYSTHRKTHAILTDRRDLLDQHGIRLNVIGNKLLFPPRLQEAARKAEEMTANNDKYVVRSLDVPLSLRGLPSLTLEPYSTCACLTRHEMK